MKITINRSRWAKGDSSGRLYNDSTDCFCAMGCILNQAAKITDTDLNRMIWPGDAVRRVFCRDRENASNELKKFWEKFYKGKSTFIDIPIFKKIMDANDDPYLKEGQREHRLKLLFKKLGFRLFFKDEK